jgi:riboflavin-specific deaminase-like protein
MVREMDLIEQILSTLEPRARTWSRPSVTLCYAQSIDGSITFNRGKPLRLSGPDSQRLTHHLRARHDAILVGIGTIMADNPRLTVRLVDGKNPQPVVLDSQLRFPLTTSLLQGERELGTRPPWIATTQKAKPRAARALEEAGAHVLQFASAPDGRVPLPDLLERLAALGIKNLMVEGGARVITSFLSAGLVDSVVITIAPIFVGGLHAVEHLAVNGNSQLYPRPESLEVQPLGEDLILWGSFGGA